MLPNARESLIKLLDRGVPFVFLTNGGGEREWKKANALSDILGLPIHPEQVILSHTPLKPEIQKFADKKILVLGCREVMDVARSYGATKPVDVPMLCHDDPYRYPFLHFAHQPLPSPLREEPFAAIFQLHDPNSWGAEIQVTLDVLRGGWPLGAGSDRQTVPFYLSNNDLTFAGVYPVPRLAAGAYTRALTHLFREVTGNEMSVTYCGKPTKMTFDFAARHVARWALLERQLDHWAAIDGVSGSSASTGRSALPPPHRDVPFSEQSAAADAVPLPPQLPAFRHIFHVGDNPSADIRGANQAGPPWHSVLVHTGVFQGHPGSNDERDPAHTVVQGIGEAVEHVLKHL